MSISNQTSLVFGTGDGSTTVFSFPFKIFAATDLVVYEINTTVTPNIAYTKVLNTDYTVSINTVGEGGTVTFTVAPTLNWQTLIQRVEPFTQSLVLNTEGNLPALQIENQLDLMTMLCIQVNTNVNHCIQVPITFNGTLPITIPTGEASAAIGWDPTGTFLVNLQVTAVGPIAVPISNGNLQALTAANLVSGASFYNLGNIPAGAGTIPVANLSTGTTNGKIPVLDSNGKVAYANLEAFPFVKLSNVQAQNTAGGGITTSWSNVLLNTLDTDTDSIATFPVNTNEVTLPAGTYIVEGQCPVYLCGTFLTRLYNITGSAVLLNGTGGLSNVNTINSVSFINGVIVLAGTTTIAFQVIGGGSQATNGQGYPTNLGPEVYATLTFTKIK